VRGDLSEDGIGKAVGEIIEALGMRTDSYDYTVDADTYCFALNNDPQEIARKILL
jgi:hypothetical protein